MAPDEQEMTDAGDDQAEGRGGEQAGIQSVETGMRLLAALAAATASGPAPMLKTLAASVDMPPAKAHRYLVSFTRAGMVEREPATGRYRLGPLARHIGISALRGFDVVRATNARLPLIRDALEETVALAIWAWHGPTIVAVEEVQRPVMVSTRVGQVMPILSSATGRVFGAWSAPSVTSKLIGREIKAGNAASIASREAAEQLFSRFRAAGLAWVEGGLNPMINALAAPIFDFRGALAGALATLGPADGFDARPDGRLAPGLRRAAAEISRDLGHAGEAP